MDFLEFLAKEHSFSEGSFSFLALLGFPEAGINSDDTIGSSHLQLIVDVARPGIETVESGMAKDHMVCTLERDHLKGYGLFVVVILIAEGNLEGDGLKGLSMAARNHSVKVTALWRSWVMVRPSFVKVSTYMIFRQLPPSIRHLENSYP
jgi:hypothetical protein